MLAAVSTQFIMMLSSEVLDEVDLTSLRVLFTGGEAVPYERAAAFEERTGAAVLQFYGSNESGALSRTSLTDTRDQRLRTAGRIIEEMEVALLDAAGNEVEVGEPGQPVCRGPATSPGYDDDPGGNELLFTPDGRMRMGDVATIDADGYLRVVGRTSDFIIRGGKNVSAPVVEDAVGAVPGVRLVAAVAWPDPVFGERVCVYVAGPASLTLEDITADLDARGISKELWPERLVVLDDLPRAPGGKIAKSELKADAERRAAD
jgi:acyl-CoA synthetase